MTKQNNTAKTNLAVLPSGAYQRAIADAENNFIRAAKGKNIDWESECTFALQACLNNKMLFDTANENPLSLKMAMQAVGAIGLTLNPAQQLAYLVPRRGKVIVDISYRGLIRIATDTGSVLVAKAELVYANDKFAYNGMFKEPLHQFNPFSTSRGDLIGAYCVAKTIDGVDLVESMPLSELLKVRDASQAYQYAVQKKESCAHMLWPEEFHKKAVIKRASKTWPKTDRRLHDAIQYLNDEAGEGFTQEKQPVVNGMVPRVIPPTEDSELQDNEVSLFTKTMVDTLIVHAIEKNAWQAACDYAEQRITTDKRDVREIVWAHQKIKAAEACNTPPVD